VPHVFVEAKYASRCEAANGGEASPAGAVATETVSFADVVETNVVPAMLFTVSAKFGAKLLVKLLSPA
jgi:hypothetical protein